MSSGTFEADLRATREARDLSLDDIQQQTRIPVDVLRRFEEGQLVGDPTFNEVYLKAFLRSYAKAVGLSESAVLAAHAAHASGGYRGDLHPDFDPASAPSRATPGPSAPVKEPEERTTAKPAAQPAASSAAPAVEALKSAPATDAPKRSAPAPLPKARVSRPAVPSARRSFDKNWTTILGLFGAFVVILALAFYFLIFRDDSPDTEPQTVTNAAGDVTPIDTSGVGAGAATGGPQLQFPIQAVVTAGGDGLQWFRVTADAGDRTPHWIDLGASQTFEADSSLVLWGEGNEGDTAYAFDETTVEIQGLRFTPQNGRPLRIDRQNGQRVLDSLATASSSPAPAPAGEVPAADPAAFE